MHIQYASDFHLELYPSPIEYSVFLTPSAPYLALAGDIGSLETLKPFFDWATSKWKRIFYIAGNHEYYTHRSKTVEELTEGYKQLGDTYTNIEFLYTDRPSVYIEDENVCIIGLTLWSNVTTTSHSWRKVSDYKMITVVKNERTMPSHLNALHQRDVAVLREEYEKWKSRNIPMCVMTHHMPSFRLIHPDFALSDVNSCFASHLDDLVKHPISHWIYGHSHVSGKQTLGNTVCVINARGYIDEKVRGYKQDACIETTAIKPIVENTIDEEVDFM
jgi:predicted phosphodiesterase